MAAPVIANPILNSPFGEPQRHFVFDEEGITDHVGCTRTTERLLQYWNDPDRERKLFFCQREALETAIYLTEVAGTFGDTTSPARTNPMRNSSAR